MLTKKILLIIPIVLLAGCNSDKPAVTPPPQPPNVDVAQVITTQVTDSHQLSARLQAPESVAVRPRVSGYIETVNFKEGSIVQPGDLLFVIDNRSFKGEVKRLKAQLADTNSQLELAKREYRRAQQLNQQQAIAQDTVDNKYSQLQQAQARVASVTASLDLAELNLQYTQITAPIAGRISNALITKGNYVNAGQSILTTLVSTDKLYAYFDADEQIYLNYIQGQSNGNGTTDAYIRLSNASQFQYQGHVDFFDNQINQTTGTIRGRAVFDNQDGQLLPGLFVHIKLMDHQSYQGILVDDKAIGTDLNSQYVLVVDQQNQVQYRAITLGNKYQGLRVIKSGLIASDIIIVKGLQRVYPGITVAPQLTSMSNEFSLSTQQYSSTSPLRL